MIILRRQKLKAENISKKQPEKNEKNQNNAFHNNFHHT